jgi:acetyl-CoA carboxylase carboxyltransferase component
MELAGWRMQAEVTGKVDYGVDTDEEALDLVKKFLSYLPSHHNELPPRAAVPGGADEPAGRMLELVPEDRAKVYDARKVAAALCDPGSLFPLKDRFARTAFTALGRIDGRTVGILASNPMFKAGALDPDSCDKACTFFVLCDSFNIPIIILVDTPGFLIGVEGERRGAPGRIMNWMNALSLVSVLRVAITLRKNFGQAYLNMGGGRNSDEAVAWPSADFGFMDPATGVNVLHGLMRENDPERFDRMVAEIAQESRVWPLAELFETQAVIDPRDTRSYLKSILGVRFRRPSGGIGAHRLSCWPTSY